MSSPPTSFVSYYAARWLPVVGRPVLALTFDAAVSNENYSEAFVFLEARGSEDFRCVRWHADPRELKALGDVRTILEDKAMTWAHAEVNYIVSSAERSPALPIILPSWEWEKGSRLLLLDLWVRGKFQEPIKGQCRNSKSEAFREDLKACIRLRNNLLGHEDI